MALIAVRSSLAWRCNSSTFCVATVISFCALSFGNTGSGDFARRSLSVLPPPSRFACASTSALAGFSLVFALTSATSIGCARPRSLITIGAKRIVSTTAWIAIEMPSAHITSRSLRPPASASGGMRAGGSAPAGLIFAVRVPRAAGAGSRSSSGWGAAASFARAPVTRAADAVLDPATGRVGAADSTGRTGDAAAAFAVVRRGAAGCAGPDNGGVAVFAAGGGP